MVADEQRAELPGLVVPGSAQHAGGGAAHGAVGGGEAQLVQEAVRRQAPQRRGPALGLHRAQPARRQLLQRLRRRVRHDHLLRGDPGPARGLLGDVGAGEQVGGLIHLDRLRQHPAARPDRQGRPRGPARPTGRPEQVPPAERSAVVLDPHRLRPDQHHVGQRPQHVEDEGVLGIAQRTAGPVRSRDRPVDRGVHHRPHVHRPRGRRDRVELGEQPCSGGVGRDRGGGRQQGAVAHQQVHGNLRGGVRMCSRSSLTGAGAV